MARERNKLKWEPTHKLKHPDGIKSSDFTNTKPFIPSYEMEPRPDMKLLMSMEYARKWRKELEESKKPVVKDSKHAPKNVTVTLSLNKKKQNLKADNKENKNFAKQKLWIKKQ